MPIGRVECEDQGVDEQPRRRPRLTAVGWLVFVGTGFAILILLFVPAFIVGVLFGKTAYFVALLVTAAAAWVPAARRPVKRVSQAVIDRYSV